MKRLILAVASIGLLGVAFAPNAPADEWNKKTILTVSEPIQVPNQVLPPGTYVIKLLDSPSDRHIVQIFNADENHLFTTILAIPNYRLQPTGKTVVHVLGNASRAAQGFESVVLSGRQFRPGVRLSEVGGSANSGDIASSGADHRGDTAGRTAPRGGNADAA